MKWTNKIIIACQHEEFLRLEFKKFPSKFNKIFISPWIYSRTW